MDFTSSFAGSGDAALYWSELARNYASAFTFIAALLAGVFGLFRYLRSERMRQTEQVRELYTMFFDNERYRRIRFVLANPEAPEYGGLREELSSPGMPKELEGQLIDLLNFFEFVSGLTRRGLVSPAQNSFRPGQPVEATVAFNRVERRRILAQKITGLGGGGK